MKNDDILLYKSLVYVSAAAKNVGYEEAMDILQFSWRHNHNSDVSGMLIYDEAYFMQLIQGPIATINRLFDRISVDPRHNAIIIIGEETSPEPECHGWGMGFVNRRDRIEALFEKHKIRHGKALYEAPYPDAKALLIDLKSQL